MGHRRIIILHFIFPTFINVEYYVDCGRISRFIFVECIITINYLVPTPYNVEVQVKCIMIHDHLGYIFQAMYACNYL